MVSGPINSARLQQVHQSCGYVVSRLYSGLNVRRKGYLPRKFNTQPNIKSFIADWKAYSIGY